MIARNMAFWVIDPRGFDQFGNFLDGELVAEEIEINPGLGAAAFPATKELSIERLDAFKIGGGECEMEAALKWHGAVVWAPS